MSISLTMMHKLQQVANRFYLFSFPDHIAGWFNAIMCRRMDEFFKDQYCPSLS